MEGTPNARFAAFKPEYRVAVVYVASMFISIMDSTVTNVALPTFSRDFHAPISSVQWVIIGYLLSLAVFIPASGWLGDRFGSKKVMLFAIGLPRRCAHRRSTSASSSAFASYREPPAA